MTRRACLRALADGSMEAVVLVGSDPVGDFPDRALAEEALGRAGFVVAVDGFLSPSAALADVVLPVAIAHERTGTTTNIEGRVTRLAQKLVSPGQCWPDWMVAAELADRLGGGLGVSSAAELWDEIERLAPSPCRDHPVVLDTPAARDGVVAPLPASPVRITTRRVLAPLRPHGHARASTPSRPRARRPGPAWPSPPGATSSSGADATARRRGQRRRVPAPAPDAAPVAALARARRGPHLPSPDSYSLRLVSARRLYDHGVLLEACRSLAPLAAPATVRANPYDLGRLGVTTGARVQGPLVARPRSSSRPSPTTACPGAWPASTSTSHGDDR